MSILELAFGVMLGMLAAQFVMAVIHNINHPTRPPPRRDDDDEEDLGEW